MTASNVEYGSPAVAMNGEILRTVVGSGVHGIAIEGTDDRDEMGVYIEPPEMVLGMTPEQSHYISRTQPEGVRSGHGDTDLTMYSLRKYLRLAAKGNPTALLPLFAPDDALITCTRLGHELREMRDAFPSQQAVERFLGYMHNQHERMLARGKQNRVPSRPELIEKYGYDVKYASHALRLAYQGNELAGSGRLALPMEEPQRTFVLEVKRGQHSRDYVSRHISDLEWHTRDILDKDASPLPPEPDWDRITGWSIRAHRWRWGWV